MAYKFEDPASEAVTSVFSRNIRTLSAHSPRVDDYTITGAEIIALDEPGQRIEIVEAPEATASLLAQAARSINALLSLRTGWDTFAAKPTTETAARKALSILSSVLSDNTQLPDIVPTAEGGVQLEWHTGGWDVEIEVHADGSINAFVDNGDYSRSWPNHQLPRDRAFMEALQTVLHAE